MLGRYRIRGTPLRSRKRGPVQATKNWDYLSVVIAMGKQGWLPGLDCLFHSSGLILQKTSKLLLV